MASSGNDDQKTGPSIVNLSDWERRLNAFTLHFIKMFIPKLNAYKNDASPGIKIHNKEFDKFKTAGENVGKIASAINGLLGVGVKTGITIIEAIAVAHGNNTHTHTNKAKNISKIFREIDEDILKLILIAACGDIYFSFQNQFTKITDNATEDVCRGMEKLANDAVNRTFDYISKNKDENYLEAQLHHFITKGVIFGESKREPNKNIFEKPGHTIKKKNTHEIWYTTEIYENVFILRNFDNHQFVQFIRNEKKEKGEKYGCRHLLEWERDGFDSKLESVKLGNLKKVTNEITPDEIKLTKEVILKHLKTLYKQIFENYEMSTKINKIENGVEKIDLNINKIGLDNQFHYEHTDKTLSNIQLGVDNNCIDLKKISLDNKNRDEHTVNALSNIEETIKVIPDKNEISEHFNKLEENIDKTINKQTSINTKKEIKKPIWFNITAPVKSFTGRTNELTKIHELIQSKLTHSVVIKAATISGLGGIGKTELARMYVDKYRKEYYNVMWIDSETNESLKKSFINLSIEIGLPTTKLSQDGKKEEIYINIIVKNIYEFIGKSSSLVIFDNAESYEEIKDFLPKSIHPEEYQKPYILFTSRNSKWDLGEKGNIGMINLYVFSSEDAFDFIKKSLNGMNATDEEINELGETLGYLPLALSQAVSYIKNENERQFNPFGIREYLEIFTKFPKFKINEDRYQQTIMATWNITIKKISENADALDIIQMMSFMSPDYNNFFELFNRLVKDENKLWDAIDLLQKYSLIAFDKITDLASIHRLLQFAIRNQLKMNGEDIKVLDNSLDFLKYGNFLTPIKDTKRRNHPQIKNLMAVIGYASDYDFFIEKFYKNVYNKNFFEKTPLKLMAQCGNVEAIKKIVLYLKKNNPLELIDIINKNDCYGELPLDIAIINGHMNVVKYLKEIGATVSDYSINLAVECFQIDIIKFFNPPDLNYHLFNAHLKNASKCDNLNQLNNFFNPLNERDRENVIQLFNDKFNTYRYRFNFYFNEIFKSEKIMKFYIENNFHKSLCVKNVILLIENTIEYDHPIEIYKELVDLCPDKNSLVEDDKTLLHNAVEKKNRWNKWILHSAVKCGNLEIIKYLIENGADVNAVYSDNKTILHLAVEYSNLEIIKYLIENGADVNAVNKYKETILHLAFQYSNLEIIKYLIENGANVNAVDRWNNTILHLVAKNRDSNIISYFLSDEFNQKLDINATNSDGETPIYLAMKSRNSKVVQFLLNQKK